MFYKAGAERGLAPVWLWLCSGQRKRFLVQGQGQVGVRSGARSRVRSGQGFPRLIQRLTPSLVLTGLGHVLGQNWGLVPNLTSLKGGVCLWLYP